MGLFGGSRLSADDREAVRKGEEIKKRLQAYAPFARFSAIDLTVLAENGFQCRYDEMDFSAELYVPERECVRCNSNTELKIQYDIKMAWIENRCVFVPRLIIKHKGLLAVQKICETDIYIKVDENRYYARILPVENVIASEMVTSSFTIPLYQTGIELLKDLAGGYSDLKVRVGQGNTYSLMTDNYGEKSSVFGTWLTELYSVCMKAGIFNQPVWQKGEDSLHVWTRFNE